jgi:hypothetical protein
MPPRQPWSQCPANSLLSRSRSIPARESGRTVMMLPLPVGVVDGQAQLPVEGDSCVHVRDDQVELIGMGPCMLTLLSSSTWPSAYKLGPQEAVRSDGRRHRPAAAYSAIHRELSIPMTATFCERRWSASASANRLIWARRTPRSRRAAAAREGLFGVAARGRAARRSGSMRAGQWFRHCDGAALEG